MSADTQIYSDLNTYAGLQALVSNSDSPVSYRIHPVLMPQGSATPVIIYELSTGDRINTLSDAGGSGVERNVYDVIAWDDQLSGATDAAEQVRLALKNASINYVYISKTSVFDIETRLFGIRQTFAQWYRA